MILVQRLRRGLKYLFYFLIIIFLMTFFFHRIRLSGEARLLSPLGQMVEVGGHQMSVYSKGQGKQTLVFLSGGGTTSPILDFKSLASKIVKDYRIVIVEKLGYGFSDDSDGQRDIDTILSQTREALRKAKIKGPYVLVPHSMSGIEALFWAQKYPKEVSAIIGLDMSVPEVYKDYTINLPILKAMQVASSLGFSRWFPNLAQSDAYRYGNLTPQEKKINQALFYKRPLSNVMYHEAKTIKANAKIVSKRHQPQLPMLLFISNGQGTGWSQNKWQSYPINYLKTVKKGNYIKINAPHYLHNHASKKIAHAIKQFLKKQEK